MVAFNHGDDALHISGFICIDDVEPNLSIHPTNLVGLSGTVNISVQAEDSYSEVDYLELSIDGLRVKDRSGITGNLTLDLIYEWDTTEYSEGAHTITITSTDAAHNTATRTYSSSITNVIPTTGNGSDLMQFFLILLAGGVVLTVGVGLLITQGPRSKSAFRIDKYALDDIATSKQWLVILSTIDEVYITHEKRNIWDQEFIKALDRKLKQGELEIDYGNIRKALDLLVQTGLLIRKEDDTLMKSDDYDSKRSDYYT